MVCEVFSRVSSGGVAGSQNRGNFCFSSRFHQPCEGSRYSPCYQHFNIVFSGPLYTSKKLLKPLKELSLCELCL